MKNRPPFPWKPVLTLLYLVTMLAGIVRLVEHQWNRGVLLVLASAALFWIGERLWPTPPEKESPQKEK